MWDRMGIEQHVNEWIRIRIRNGGGGEGGCHHTDLIRSCWLVLESGVGRLDWVAPLVRRKLSLNSKFKNLFLFKFVSLSSPHHSIRVSPLSPPPPPLQTPVKWSECGYTVSGYSIFKNTRARAGVTHGPWPSLTPPSPTLAYTNGA